MLLYYVNSQYSLFRTGRVRTKILYIQGKPKEASACLSYLLELHTSYSDSQKIGLFSVYVTQRGSWYPSGELVNSSKPIIK